MLDELNYNFYKDWIFSLLKLIVHSISQRQWEDLLIDFQDFMLDNEPKRVRVTINLYHPKILNPDIKEFVEQTNRRLNNG